MTTASLAPHDPACETTDLFMVSPWQSPGRPASTGTSVSDWFPRPVAAVWDLLTDWRRAGDWMSDVESLRRTGPGPDRVDTRLELADGGDISLYTVEEWTPPHRLVLATERDGVGLSLEFSLMPEWRGTRLTLHARCETLARWPGLDAVVARLMRRGDPAQLEALAHLL